MLAAYSDQFSIRSED